MMNPPNPPQAGGGLAAKQAAAAAAARFAGYSQFYGTAQPVHAPYPPAMTVARPPGPPPRPGTVMGPPRGPYARPPPPPPAAFGFQPNGAPPSRPPPPPRGFMRPPPPRAVAATSAPPAAAPPQWQWSNGKASMAPTPPVRFALPPRNHLAAPPRGFAPPQPATSAPPPAPSPASAGAVGGGNTKWPDSLHDYVKRAFARCKGAADQALTQQALKDMITNAIMANNLWTRNWGVEPLPTLVGDTKPAQMAAAAGGKPGMAHPSPMNNYGGNPLAFGPMAGSAHSAAAAKKLKRKHNNDDFADSIQDMQKKNQRRQRFLKDKAEMAKMVTPTVDTKKLRVINDEGELDLDAMVIKGTCQTVEKEYLRLTSAPHPSTVRPEPVLKEALALVKKKWKKGKCDYVYACSQLKSIRQDCTVQHIKNDFTVLVYETHARVALESGDINEFNQCQTQLHELYEQALPGQAVEFLAYRILYSVYVSLQAKKADSNAGVLGMYSVLASITDKLRADPAVAHALAVRAAVAVNDYHRFFQLYVDAPNMAGYLMDPMVPAIRLAALRAMCKAYRPTLSLQYVQKELKLEGKNGDEFIAKCGLAFVKGKESTIDTKNSDIVWVLSDQSSLI